MSMTDNRINSIDPSIPRFWVHCEAWNDWPERVLISKKTQGEADGESWYIPERTCEQVDVTDKCQPYVTHITICSLCREILAFDEYTAPNYCPSCGAKIIDKVVE